MKKIRLSKRKVALVDDSDFEFLNQWKWTASQESAGGAKFYAIRWSRKSEHGSGKRFKIRIHRVIMGLSPADDLVVDHENRSGLDNRRVNLRVMTQRENIARSTFGRRKEERASA